MRSIQILLALFLVVSATEAVSQAIPVPITERSTDDGWLGVVLDDDSGEVIARQVLPRSPAQRAGLERGDTILAVDGVSVASSAATIALVREVGADGCAVLTVRRGANEHEMEAILGVRPPNLALAQALVGMPFPWISGDEVRTGRPVPSPAESDTWTVIEFWATWCGPCHLAAPRMVALHAAREEHGVEFIGIAMDPVEDLRSFLEASSLAWPQIADPDGTRNNEALVIAQPTWFLLAPGGEIRGAFIGLGGLDGLERALGDLSAYSESPK
jgi:thiol-disulfide isomerase/thioredoxin